MSGPDEPGKLRAEKSSYDKMMALEIDNLSTDTVGIFATDPLLKTSCPKEKGH